MIYSLFSWLDQMNIPGAGLFHYISFRASLALITSLIVSVIIGKRIINRLRAQQIGETVRDLGLAGQIEKSGTPTMGGLIILAAILIPTLLFAKLQNVYVITMLIATVWLGIIGFLDDNPQFHRQTVLGQTIYNPLMLDKLSKKKDIDLILLALPLITRQI